MTKIYQEYKNLQPRERNRFAHLLHIHNRVMEHIEALAKLKLKLDKEEERLIAYLTQEHYSGIRWGEVIAYPQQFFGGAPSFLQILKAVVKQLCNKDRILLQDTYKNTIASRPRTLGVVIKVLDKRKKEN